MLIETPKMCKCSKEITFSKEKWKMKGESKRTFCNQKFYSLKANNSCLIDR